MKQNSLYNILGIKSNATYRDIKRAYYRLVSKYSPEKNPERFRMLRTAYETLSDPQTRESYDSLEKYDSDVLDLFNKFEKLKIEKKWDEAIKSLNDIIKIKPQDDALKNQLGICYLNSHQYDKSLEVFKSLVLKNPKIAVYWNNYGQCLKLKGEKICENVVEKEKLYEAARGYFKKAIDLNAFDSQPYLAISDIYLNEKKYENALEWANKAIGADNQMDFNDFEAMFQLCKIYLYQNKVESIDKEIKKIISVIPEDRDYHRFVSARFVSIAEQLILVNEFEVAVHFYKGALKFNSKNDDLIKALERAKLGAGAIKDYSNFSKNKEIIKPLRKKGALSLSLFMKKDVSNESEINEEINSQLPLFSIQSIISSIGVIREKYKGIYNLSPSYYEKIENLARKRNEELCKHEEKV